MLDFPLLLPTRSALARENSLMAVSLSFLPPPRQKFANDYLQQTIYLSLCDTDVGPERLSQAEYGKHRLIEFLFTH